METVRLLVHEEEGKPSLHPDGRASFAATEPPSSTTSEAELSPLQEASASEDVRFVASSKSSSVLARVAMQNAAHAAGDNVPLPASSRTAAGTSASLPEKISLLAVVVHLLKGNIGPGAMSLPSGFSKTGIYAAPVYFVLVALVSTYNMDLLLYCKQAVSPTRKASFGDVAGKILGPRGKLLIDIFLVGTQLGICCVYFTFIATNIHVVLPDSLQDVIHERQLILVIYPVILLLSWIRTLKRLTPFSSLANVAVVLGITIVFYYSFDYYQHPRAPRVEPVHADISQFPQFYGTAVYSFEGIGLILPIQNEMRDPHLFPRVLVICMLAILVLFLFIGELPTLAFGQISNGSMTAVLHEFCEGWLVAMSNLMLAFACLLSFPIQFYPAVDVLEKALNKRGSLMRPMPARNYDGRAGSHPSTLQDDDPVHVVEASQRRRATATTCGMSRCIDRTKYNPGNNSSSTALGTTTPSVPRMPRQNSIFGLSCIDSMFANVSQYEFNRTLFRSMLCTSLMLIAVCVPDISLLISLFGAVGSSVLAIIIPPVLYVRLHKDELSPVSRLGHYSIIAVGTVGMLAGTVQAGRDIVNSFLAT